jgi:diguanylate cyclase (GGDEF)-like protein
MAITDIVSGLYTHGYMQDALEREFRRCKYENLPLSTIILDVDHFKIVNDTYGHPQGDALLRQLGAVIKTVTRSSDIVCRYGGDEFMVILPETNRIGTVLVAERIRQAVEEYEFVLGSKIVHITISGGVASFPEDITTKKELIDKTDQALYQSKQGGRNKISFIS